MQQAKAHEDETLDGEHVQVDLPCNGCTACCQNDAIFLKPGDDPDKYQTEEYQGALMLAHKPNGDCVYLERGKGCTIHEDRPIVCRSLDCRILLELPRWMQREKFSKAQIRAAKRMKAKMRYFIQEPKKRA